MRAVRSRRDVPGPDGESGPAPARSLRAARTLGLDLPRRVGALALVALLALGAPWLDRDRHEPIAGYGVIPQPGEVTVTAPGPALVVGQQASNFRLLATDGEVVELASLRGRPVLLHFWTTWCLECTSAMPGLQQLATDRGDLQLLAIDVAEDSGRAGDAADRLGVTYPVLLDTDEEVSHRYGVWEYPVTIVIDAEGVIVAIHAGPMPLDQVRAEVEALPGA